MSNLSSRGREYAAESINNLWLHSLRVDKFCESFYETLHFQYILLTNKTRRISIDLALGSTLMQLEYGRDHRI